MNEALEYAKRMSPDSLKAFERLADREIEVRGLYEKIFNEFGYELTKPANWEIPRTKVRLEEWRNVGITAKISIVFALLLI